MDYTWQYYDIVLVAVAMSLLVGGVVGYATAVAFPVAVTGASLVAIAVIGHGLFVNGPIDKPADLAEEVQGLN